MTNYMQRLHRVIHLPLHLNYKKKNLAIAVSASLVGLGWVVVVGAGQKTEF